MYGGNEAYNTNGIYFAMNGSHPDFIFGDDLTVKTSGDFVDAIRTNGQQATNGAYTVMVGDRATLIATGSNSNGINVAQSPAGQAGYGRVYLGNNSTITGSEGYAVYANKGGVVQLQGTSGATSVSTEGANADGLRAEGSHFTGMTKVVEYAYDRSGEAVSDAKGTVNLNINGVGSI